MILAESSLAEIPLASALELGAPAPAGPVPPAAFKALAMRIVRHSKRYV